MISSRGRILIVDDEKVNRDILSVLLEEHSTVGAKNGEQALKRAASENPPDLILLDVVMPGLNGYEVAEQLKNNELTKDIPIIFITVKNSVEEESRGLELGAVDYITKPFSPGIVKARIRNHIELKKQRDLLAQLNVTDGLTGIYNRRHFDNYLHQKWQIAHRTNSVLSLIMIDIDYFKPFNDNYGHGNGDQCLIQVAQKLSASVERDIDLVARYGGEEFGVILPGTDANGAECVAENLRCAVQELEIPHNHSTVSEIVTISLGVSTILPDASDDVVQFLSDADQALYQAKTRGRNGVVRFNTEK